MLAAIAMLVIESRKGGNRTTSVVAEEPVSP